MDAAVRFPTTPRAVKAVPVRLARRMSVEQAFQAIVRSCLEQVQGNEPGVMRFHDVESLHQMRVGLRRLRSALAMFDKQIGLPAHLQPELVWLADRLGPARDWDVLAESTLARVAAQEAEERAELAPLCQAVQAQSHAMREATAGALASARYSHLMRALERWVDQRGWRELPAAGGTAGLKRPIIAFADAILERDQQRLLKRGRRLAGASVDARHRVRIAAKKARYAAEFFGSLYPGKQVRPYLKALGRLQQDLGRLNDAAVAEPLLDELVQRDAGLARGAAYVRGYLAACSVHDEARLRTHWKRFAVLSAPG